MRHKINFVIIGMCFLCICSNLFAKVTIKQYQYPETEGEIFTGQQTVWGIANESCEIFPGEMISDVGIEVGSECFLYVIDNPNPGIGFVVEKKFNIEEFRFGTSLLNTFYPGTMIYLSTLNDPNGQAWSGFQKPFIVAGNNFSSTLLGLMDYSGTGRSFGLFIFGDATEIFITLEISSLYTGEYVRNIDFHMNMLYEFMEHWLEETEYPSNCFPDCNEDGIVNFLDWVYIAKIHNS